MCATSHSKYGTPVWNLAQHHQYCSYDCETSGNRRARHAFIRLCIVTECQFSWAVTKQADTPSDHPKKWSPTHVGANISATTGLLEPDKIALESPFQGASKPQEKLNSVQVYLAIHGFGHLNWYMEKHGPEPQKKSDFLGNSATTERIALKLAAIDAPYSFSLDSPAAQCARHHGTSGCGQTCPPRGHVEVDVFRPHLEALRGDR